MIQDHTWQIWAHFKTYENFLEQVFRITENNSLLNVEAEGLAMKEDLVRDLEISKSWYFTRFQDF